MATTLWSELITPAELTGYARAALEDYEASKGTLAAFLPNREVPDIEARFIKGNKGLVEEASFRAFDAEPEEGSREPRSRVRIELPAIGQTLKVSEWAQLRARNATDDEIRNQVLRDAEQVVRAIADRIERLRGTVLVTGKATIDQENFAIEDDFGRSASHTVTAPQLWDDASVDRLSYLETLLDVYRDTNGEEPGALVMSQRVLRALATGDQFKTVFTGGGTRDATQEQVFNTLSSAGLPPVTIYDRKTRGGRVIPNNVLMLLPAAVSPTDWQGTDLGATFWGQTLTSMDDRYKLAPSEQPGIVVGLFRGDRPPMAGETIADAIAEPVLANADLSLVATVLAA